MFENFMNPSGIKGHVYEDGGSVVSGASSAVYAHTHNDLTVTLLTYERAAVVLLTHSFISPTTSTQFRAGDLKTSSVKLLASFVANYW